MGDIVEYTVDYIGKVTVAELTELKQKTDAYILSNEEGDKPRIQSSAAILAQQGIPPCGYVEKPTLVIQIKLDNMKRDELYNEITSLVRANYENRYSLETSY